MKSKFPVVVPVALMLGAYILFGTFSVVHAEDVIPTPEVTPTESATPAATEPTPTESPTPEPTTSSTPDPVLTATPADDGMEMLAMSGPMLLGAAPVGPVWFTSSVGVQSYFTIAEAWGFIKGGLLPSDGIIHLDSTYGLDTDEGLDPIELYPQSTVSSTSIKGILGPSDLDPVTMKPIVRINNPFSVFGFTNGFVVSNISFVGSAGDDGVTEGELKIIDISGNVKLTNLDVQNTDSRGVGLIVETINGSIIVTNLDSSENAGGGAYLRTGTSGSITVTNSSFNNNPGVLSSDGTEIAGLVVETINSNSPVVLNGVSASGNTSPDTPGVLIKKSGTLTIKNSMFNNNLGGGLANKLDPVKPTIQGATVLDNVTASDNYQDTPDIRGGSGIELYTNGAITANNIYATGNLNYGMKLDNCNFAGAACTSTSTGAVNFTNSEFSSNIENSGLDIRSRGAVTLKKVTASENLNSSAFGVKIDNTFGTAGVTITGTVGGDNQFIHNGTHGVQIDSIGNISLNYISSEENTGDGAWLVNKVGKGTVSVSNSRFYHNSSNGLYIESKGTITLLNVLSSENAGGNGVIIDNRIFATGAGFGNVTITNLTAVNNSDWGLDVLSNGTITVTGITANQNPVGGANLNNQEAILPKNVSLSKSVFDANKLGGELGPGLVVLSKGAITLTGVGTKNNGLEGILLDNPSSVGAVVINNSSNPTLYSVVGNGEEGVVITTQGAVSLTGVFADSNRIGAVINNYVVGKTPPVAISASHFNENTGGEGLNVNSTGKITLTKVSASENSSFGAKLANENATVLSAVSIVNDVLKIGSELNGFCGNGFYGLMITAKGVVTLTNVEASGNGSFGVDISNNYAANADVKISNSYFYENDELFPSDGYGLNVTSMGNISLSGGSANNNYLYGAKLDNQNGSAFPVKNITITKFEFNNNQTSFGLEAHANGTITITR